MWSGSNEINAMQTVSVIDRNVLVLNQTYEPLHICNVKRAIVLILERKASMVKTADHILIHSVAEAYPVPAVIRIHQYVHLHRWEAVLNKANILRRDGHTCQYCGARNVPLTIDHVIPKVLGGQDTWNNLVSACVSCNNRKGDRTPEQAGLVLLSKPIKPHKVHTLQRFTGSIYKEWKPFLFLD